MFPLHINREDLIVVLASFGAEFPGDIKMPSEELGKLVTRALNYSQKFDDLFDLKPNSKLDPHTYPKWTGNQSLTTAMHSRDIGETVMGSAPVSQLKQGANSPKANIFTELRQTAMGLGYAMDMGKSRVFFTGQGNDWIIDLRIISVHQVNDETPLFIINYKHEELPSGNAQEHVQNGYTPIVISDLERRMLLALWDLNATRLATKHHSKAKMGYLASMVLPLGSISMKDLGSLTHNPGCAVCGVKSHTKCNQCLSVVYCGKECQRIDWPTHKTQCISLKGATWHKVKLSASPFMTLLNRNDQLNRRSNYPIIEAAADGGPAYGKVFLAKFQLPMGGTGAGILIYDRQRSFTKVWEKSNPAAYALAFQEAQKSGIPKLYRLLRRVSEDEYEVCLDRAPTKNPVW